MYGTHAHLITLTEVLCPSLPMLYEDKKGSHVVIKFMEYVL
jgi:hypothetical protein